MPTFPQSDLEGFHPAVELFSDPMMFEVAHTQVEGDNALFSVAHPALTSYASQFPLTDREAQAFLSGVRAFEVVSSIAVPLDTHRRYAASAITGFLIDEESPNFILHLLEDVDEAGKAMLALPELSGAIRTLAAADIADSSPELGYRALSGAAILRKVQLDVDERLAFETDVANL